MKHLAKTIVDCLLGLGMVNCLFLIAYQKGYYPKSANLSRKKGFDTISKFFPKLIRKIIMIDNLYE